jgi:hypothetical protein
MKDTSVRYEVDTEIMIDPILALALMTNSFVPSIPHHLNNALCAIPKDYPWKD